MPESSTAVVIRYIKLQWISWSKFNSF